MNIIIANKTKITGAILAALATAQASSSTMQALIPPKAFAWLTLAIGVLITFFGFLNSSTPTPDSKSPAIVIPPTEPTSAPK